MIAEYRWRMTVSVNSSGYHCLLVSMCWCLYKVLSWRVHTTQSTAGMAADYISTLRIYCKLQKPRDRRKSSRRYCSSTNLTVTLRTRTSTPEGCGFGALIRCDCHKSEYEMRMTERFKALPGLYGILWLLWWEIKEESHEHLNLRSAARVYIGLPLRKWITGI